MLATLPVVRATEIVAGPAGRLGCDGDPSGQAIGSKWVLKRENTVPDASRVSIVATHRPRRAANLRCATAEWQ